MLTIEFTGSADFHVDGTAVGTGTFTGRTCPPLRGGHRLRGLTGQPVAVERSTPDSRAGPRFGVDAETEDGCSAALADYERDHWRRSLPPTIVGRDDAETSFGYTYRTGRRRMSSIRLEDGSVRGGVRQGGQLHAPFDLDGQRIGERRRSFPAGLPLGYHQVHLRPGDHEATAPADHHPSWLGMPSAGACRLWGWRFSSTASVREFLGRRRSRGPADLAVWAGARHGRVCAGQSSACRGADHPYGTFSLSADVATIHQSLYLRIEGIPSTADWPSRSDRTFVPLSRRGPLAMTRPIRARWGGETCRVEAGLPSAQDGRRRVGLRCVQRPGRRGPGRFRDMVRLAERFGADWHNWPEGFRHPSSPDVAEFAREHDRKVDFHRWLR